MKEQLIRVETAILAHKSGFFEWINSNVVMHLKKNENSPLHNYPEPPYHLCVTQSLLQKWLREEKNIHVPVDFNHNDELGFIYTVHRDYEELVDIIFSRINNPPIRYKTYEEALEAGLQEALKLIK